MEYMDLGLREYGEVWKLQEDLFNQNVKAKTGEGTTSNYLLFCEHPHVITIGKNGKADNLLFAEEILKGRGVSLFRIDRGGDVTYHGPGQLVAYPVFDLESFDLGLRRYIYNLEEVMIRFLELYSVIGMRSDNATGVWLDADNPRKMRKIGAIGVRSSRFITMHGFALNINTDLSYFSLINPCGFTDRGVTSLEAEIGGKADMEVVKQQIKHLFEDIFCTK